MDTSQGWDQYGPQGDILPSGPAQQLLKLPLPQTPNPLLSVSP